MKNEVQDNTFIHLWEEAEKAAEVFHFDIPDSSRSWAVIARHLEKKRIRSRRFKHLQMAAVIAAAVMVGAITFSIPQVGSAFQPVAVVIKNVTEDLTELFYDTGSTVHPPLSSPPPPEDPSVKNSGAVAPSQSQFVTLEEARSRSPYPLAEPAYLPEGYSFSKAELEVSGGEIKRIKLTYGNETRSFTIFQTFLKFNTTIWTKISGNQKTITFRGRDALIFGDNGIINMMYTLQDEAYLIYGALSEQEIIKIAESIK